MEGMKTGFTSAAGFNLLASAHRGEKRILAVVLGGVSSGSRNAAMRNILDASWSKAMTQTAARKSGIEVASVRHPVEVTIEHPRRVEHAQEERPGKKAINPSRSTAATLAPATPQPLFQLKRKPDGASAGTLIAAIENGLVARRPLGRPKAAVAAPDMTTDEPEERAEAETTQSATYAPPAPQEIARNETLVAQVQPAQIKNVSIHYKTLRQVDVEPLAAVSLDAAPIDPKIVKVQTTGALKVQTASAVEREGVKPQRLATVTPSVSREIVDHPGPYYVQVGSFADEAQAAQRLESVNQALGPALLKTHPEFVVPIVLPSGVTMYRARLGRFADEAQAKSACKKLRNNGIECWDMRAR
jgi:D-alanyl-D-alanine carboxypeptidase